MNDIDFIFKTLEIINLTDEFTQEVEKKAFLNSETKHKVEVIQNKIGRFNQKFPDPTALLDFNKSDQPEVKMKNLDEILDPKAIEETQKALLPEIKTKKEDVENLKRQRDEYRQKAEEYDKLYREQLMKTDKLENIAKKFEEVIELLQEDVA